jgi:hypothetical protein
MRFFALWALAALAAGCGSPAPACVENLDPTCKPLYEPTFDNVFNHTLHTTCAQSGSSCHGLSGGKGGLVFDDADSAYQNLTGGAAPRVIAGDAACSLLVERIESPHADFVMPPGAPLSAPERCAIEQWIHNGAKR